MNVETKWLELHEKLKDLSRGTTQNPDKLFFHRMLKALEWLEDELQLAPSQLPDEKDGVLEGTFSCEYAYQETWNATIKLALVATCEVLIHRNRQYGAFDHKWHYHPLTREQAPLVLLDLKINRVLKGNPAHTDSYLDMLGYVVIYLTETRPWEEGCEPTAST